MGGPASNAVDLGFPYAESSISYTGFSNKQLKQESSNYFNNCSSSSSSPATARPPWALGAAAVVAAPLIGTSSSATAAAAAQAQYASHLPTILGQQQQIHHQAQHHHQHHHPLHQHQQQQQQQPHSSASFPLPYEAAYKSALAASASSSGGGGYGAASGGGGLSFKDHRGRHQYPLQYNGGSLVLDHNRGELINLSKMTPQEILDAKALAASKSHSEAERRRRERINNHLNTLRSLLPSTTKTDKASLLAEVIEHVKELKRQAAEIAEGGPVPSDVDELKVDADASSTDGNLVMKASLCCDDRPDLLTDLTKVLKTLKLKTLKAEIATLGGRVKNVIVIGKDGSGAEGDAGAGPAGSDRPSVNCVQEALRQVIERSNDLSGSGYSGGKRQKVNHHQEAPSY